MVRKNVAPRNIVPRLDVSSEIICHSKVMFEYIYTAFSWIWQPATYRQWAYLAIGGLLGAMCLAVLKILEAVGVTLIVAWMCAPIPIIIILLFSKTVREWDRRLINFMLGTAVPATPEADLRPDPDEHWSSLALGLAPGFATWRFAGWLLLRVLTGSQALLISILVLIGPLAIIVSTIEYDLANRLSAISFALFILLVVLLFVFLLLGMCINARLGAEIHAGLAASLLGPPSEKRLVELRYRNNQLRRSNFQLNKRDHLFRKLHASMDDKLSVSIAQAGAARRALATDPQFVLDTLNTIEHTSNEILEETAQSVESFHDDYAAQTETISLENLYGMFGRIQATGLPMTLTTSGDLSRLPVNLIKAVYDTVEAGYLTIRHCFGTVPIIVSVIVNEDSIEVEITGEPSISTSALDATLDDPWLLKDVKKAVEDLQGFFRVDRTADNHDLVCVSLPLRDGIHTH